MSTSISYKNLFNDEITLQQTKDLDAFIQVVIENGKKRQNVFKNGIITHTSYNVDTINDISEILATNRNASFQILEIVNENFKVSKSLEYKNSQLIRFTKLVSDDSDNPICYQEYDPISNLPLYLSTEKSYFNNGKEIYAFGYNQDGSCFSIVGMQIEDLADSDFYPDEFNWTGLEYYQHAEPLVPQTIIINQ